MTDGTLVRGRGPIHAPVSRVAGCVKGVDNVHMFDRWWSTIGPSSWYGNGDLVRVNDARRIAIAVAICRAFSRARGRGYGCARISHIVSGAGGDSLETNAACMRYFEEARARKGSNDCYHAMGSNRKKSRQG